jgi:charged multivesicular body protein 3
MEEMTSDMIDSALDFEDMEDEIEEEVDKVLAELAAETSSQLPAAARAQGIKQVSVGRAQGEVCAFVECPSVCLHAFYSCVNYKLCKK